ncbi:hypothetical protein OVA24_16815 [Luteolibacter sp. SL250]|uniref:hypothetical protein n=1 Tax=Luteolibacter sp. SL250 TaxID=2995170 RepID=UPI00226E0E8D|nr:hypothetical protein [Luteolibacter sp. SL250]WAC18895.1 hypothetical protein OVA24_16815 [Luteolibacter sp. SL250]
MPNENSFLFTVTDRFSLDGRGVIIVPGIPWQGAPVVKKGDPLLLRTPLGEVIHTMVRDLERIRYLPEGKRNEATPILLPKEIHKFDIPIGTEVFLGATDH